MIALVYSGDKQNVKYFMQQFGIVYEYRRLNGKMLKLLAVQRQQHSNYLNECTLIKN